MQKRKISVKQKRRNRQVQLQKQGLIISFTLCFVLILALTFGSFLSKAQSDHQEEQEFKYFTSMQIEVGDTLWSIAQANMGSHYDSEEEYIEEVKHMNTLDGDIIHAGQYIIIPYYASEFES